MICIRNVFQHFLPATFRLLLCLAVLSLSAPGWAQDATSAPAAARAEVKTEVTYPGLTEVVPKATAVNARIAEANAILKQSDKLQNTYTDLEKVGQQLQTLEEEYKGWDTTANWPLNRLMTAEARYNELRQQLEQLSEPLNNKLGTLEDLRVTWQKEKEFWNNWHKNLKDSGVKAPAEVFSKTLNSIDELLKKISAESSALVKRQESFSSEQEIINSRLVIIDKALEDLRKDTLRRNAYSLFSSDFYSQLTPELFKEYRDNLVSTLQLPDGFWQRHGLLITIQLVSIVVLAYLLVYRRKQKRTISIEWRFLFKHPVAGAVFITIAITGGFYQNIPPSWLWLVMMITTISGTVLVSAMAENQRRRHLIRALAVIYLVSETLKSTGLPTPAYQLYEVALCALVAPLSLVMARRRHKQVPDRLGLYLVSLYLISAFAFVGLITTLLGFATLSTHLIDAVLGTIIVTFLARIAIHLADGGITEFLHHSWVRGRQLTLRLGTSTSTRLKRLARIVILVNTGLYLLVLWDFYNNIDEAATQLLNLEYTIGEFTISVFMVVMLSLVLYLTNLFSWLLQGIIDAQYMTPRRMDIGVKEASKRLIHYALFTIGFFIAISMAGLDLQKFTIIAGALGVGIGFGLQNIVNNFVSGLILLFERPVKVGDTINIDDQWGTITKIGLRSTVFETLDRSEIIVPNSDLISQKVTNWTFTTNISRVVLNVGVAYGSALDKVLEILQRVAEEHPDVMEEPEASAIFTGFGDSSIDFELRVWIPDISKRLKVKSELGQAVDRYFREEDITIPFPQRDLHLRSIESNLQGLLKSTASTAEE